MMTIIFLPRTTTPNISERAEWANNIFWPRLRSQALMTMKITEAILLCYPAIATIFDIVGKYLFVSHKQTL